jgi:hypothetical protein
MFYSHQKNTGVSYTATVACVAAAIISPVVLVALSAFGTETVSFAMTASALCFALSLITWKRSSLSIPSLAVQQRMAK